MSFIRNKRIGGNIYRYRVETYYTKDGKPRQRVLEYLGRVVKTKRGEKLIKPRSSIDRLDVVRVSSFGPVAVLLALADDLDVVKTIDGTVPQAQKTSTGALLLLMAINHLVGRKSVSKIPTWYRRTSLPRLLGIPPDEVTKERLLGAMDALCYKDESGAIMNYAPILHRKFWDAHRESHPESSTLFYDLTDVIVHGITCELAKVGYNSRKSLGKRQVKVAAVIAKGSRFPVMMKELRGNIADPATLDDLLVELKEMGVKKCTLVLDRSFSNGKALEMLEKAGFEAILGLSKRSREVRDILLSVPDKGLERLEHMVKRSQGLSYVKGVKRKLHGKVRNIAVCLSPLKREEERVERMNVLKETVEHLGELGRKVEAGNYRNLDRLRKRVNEEVKEVRKYIQAWVRGTPGKPEIGWAVNDSLLDEEMGLDGKFAILCPDGMTAIEAFEDYFQKDEIEKVFRSMKGTLEFEPLRHRLRWRVVSYLFTGYLAYMLLSVFARRLKLAGIKKSPEEVLEMLEEIEEVTIRRDGKEFSKITRLARRQAEMVKAINLLTVFSSISA